MQTELCGLSVVTLEFVWFPEQRLSLQAVGEAGILGRGGAGAGKLGVGVTGSRLPCPSSSPPSQPLYFPSIPAPHQGTGQPGLLRCSPISSH